jgi:tetratricopeptide (TPR) repeat protein
MTLEAALARRAACDYRGERDALRGSDDPEAQLELGRVLEELGEYDEAERVLLQLAEGAEPALRARALARLSVVLRSQRRSAESEAVAREAVELTPTPETLVELAVAHLDLDRRDDAERDLARIGAPADDRTRFAVQVARPSLARDRGEYAVAKAGFEKAIEFAESSFGAESLEVALALNALGMTYKFWGRFDDARPVYLRALAIIERAGGEDHPDLAALYHNLGGLDHARGAYEDAERHARRSVEIRTRVAGADSVGVAEDEAALAAILHALGRDDEAETLLRRALPRLEEALGPDHHEVAANLNNLGSILQRQGKLDEAASVYASALERKERLYRCDHPSVATTLNNLGVVLRGRGRIAEAKAHYERALGILERTVDPDHPLIATTRRNLDKLAALEEDAVRIRPGDGDPTEGRAMTEEPKMLANNTNETPADDDVEAHAAGTLNVNEAAASTGWGPNTNESAEDDDIRAGWGANTNESALDDDVEAHAAGSLNVNESVIEDVEAHGWDSNVNETPAEDDGDVPLAIEPEPLAA